MGLWSASFSVFNFKFRGLLHDWQATCNPPRPQLQSLFSSFEECNWIGNQSAISIPRFRLISLFKFRGLQLYRNPNCRNISICQLFFVFRLFLKEPDDECRSLVFVWVLMLFTDGLFLSAIQSSTGTRTS